MITPTISVLILALLGVSAGFSIVALNRARRKALAGPVCGKCGYSALGLTAMTCPECGCDFRDVGIVTPDTPRRTGPLGAYVLFTVLLVPIALVGSGAFLSVVPIRRSYDREIQLAGPHSKAYRRVVIRAHDQSFGTPERVLPVDIELISNPPATGPSFTATAHAARMKLRPGDGYEYVAGSAPVTSQKAFGTDAVITWMNASGIQTNSKYLRHEAARIAGQAQAASRNGMASRSQERLVGYSSSSSSSNDVFSSITSTEVAESSVPAFIPFILVALWLLFWIAGLIHLSGRNLRGHKSVVACNLAQLRPSSL